MKLALITIAVNLKHFLKLVKLIEVITFFNYNKLAYILLNS
jgi:hypothetical protein